MECNIQFPFLVNRTTAAFFMTCEKLFQHSKHVYFWTFTFENVYSDWIYSAAWGQFIRTLQHYHGDMLLGVRVIEPHREHGLHYHALVNVRIPIEQVRRVGRKVGMGIVWVEEARPEVIIYLAKYLQKGFRKRTVGLYKGLHKWNTIGGFRGVRCKDLVHDSECSWGLRWLAKQLGEPISYHFACITYTHLKCYGIFEKWERESAVRYYQTICAAASQRHASEGKRICDLVYNRIGEIRSKESNLPQWAKEMNLTARMKWDTLISNGRWLSDEQEPPDSDSCGS